MFVGFGLIGNQLGCESNDVPKQRFEAVREQLCNIEERLNQKMNLNRSSRLLILASLGVTDQ